MNQYKLYCVNENKSLIIKGLNTNDKTQIKNEIKSYLSKLYPGKKLNENFVITSNPQGYGLNPKDKSSWIDVKKEMLKESVVKHFTDKIYESIVKGEHLSNTLNQKHETSLSEASEKWKDIKGKKKVSEEDRRLFRESVKKLVAQNINETLNEAYAQTVNENIFNTVGTIARNIGSSAMGNATISPKVYNAARKLGKAIARLEQTWKSTVPFLGDRPNFNATAPWRDLENAIKTALPRFKYVKDIKNPKRADLVGKHFVSDREIEARVEMLSSQQISQANQIADDLRTQVGNLRAQDEESKQIIDGLNAQMQTLEQLIGTLGSSSANQAETIEKLEAESVEFKANIEVLKQQRSVDQQQIANLEARSNRLFSVWKQTRKDKKQVESDLDVEKKQRKSVEDQLDYQVDKHGSYT